MTHFLHSQLSDSDVELHVVYADTGIMLPIVRSYVEETCRKYGWNLTVVEGNFFQKVERHGMPSTKRRWCCWECKIKPISEFTKKLPPQRAEAAGLRRDESFRRSKIENAVFCFEKGRVWKYAPILCWREKDVLHYIREHNLPFPPHYRLGLRETCMCGVYSIGKQILILKAQFPELWRKIVETEAGFRSHGATFYFRNKPVYAKSLNAQTTITDFSKTKRA